MRMVAMAVLAMLGCKSRGEDPPPPTSTPPASPAKAKTTAGQLAKRGAVRRPPEAFFAVILPAGAAPEKCEAAGQAAATKAGIAIVDAAAHPHGTSIVLDRTTPPKVGWKADRSKAFDKLLPEGASAELDKATVAIGLFGTSDRAEPRLAEHTARVAQAIAQSCQGWIVDVDTNRILPTDKVVDHVPGARFDARTMMVLHAVSGENELGFIDTGGLARLGFPELYLPAVPPANATRLASLVNATVQTLVDQGDLIRDGEIVVDVTKLAGEWHAKDVIDDGGTGTFTWQVKWSKGDGADADAPLVLELGIPGARPGDAAALLAALETYEGESPDKVQQIDFGPELETVAVKARAALVALRAHFKKGIPPGERLSIKAPFETDHDSKEWMWVDVFAFKDATFEGVLANTPDDVKALKLGTRVKVKLTDVADFIHRRADKTNVGGYSFDVMRKHGIDVPPLSEM